MSGSNRLGPLVTIGNIRDACLVLAGRDGRTSTTGWLPDSLWDAALQEGRAGDWIAAPRSWRMARTITKWPSALLPAVVVAVPGTSAAPKRRGDGTYDATWAVTFAAILAGRDDDDTDAQASIYEAALRQMFLQRAEHLPGLTVKGNTWAGSQEDELPQQAGHDPNYLRTISVNFDLELSEVSTVIGGLAAPSVPPLGPAGAYPTADTVTVDLEKTPT